MIALGQPVDAHSTSGGGTSSLSGGGCFVYGSFCDDLPDREVEFAPVLDLLKFCYGAVLGKEVFFDDVIWRVKYYPVVSSSLILSCVSLRRFGYWSGFCSRNRGRHFRYCKNSA